MSAISSQPHLVVQHTDKNAELDEDVTWYDYRNFHIAASDEQSNNEWVGAQINALIDGVAAHPKRWWRIVYRNERTLETTEGTKSLGAESYPVTDASKRGEHVEEFIDRNGDGFYELNRGMPVFPEYPRFYTEHDDVGQAEDGDPGVIKVGDYVKVSEDPKCLGPSGQIDGYVMPAFAGQVCKVIGVPEGDGNHTVVLPPPSELTNVIHESHLTKVNKDGSPIEHPDHDAEFEPGEEVEDAEGGEDHEVVHISDGDVLEVYDEFGHKRTIQISVV